MFSGEYPSDDVLNRLLAVFLLFENLWEERKKKAKQVCLRGLNASGERRSRKPRVARRLGASDITLTLDFGAIRRPLAVYVLHQENLLVTSENSRFFIDLIIHQFSSLPYLYVFKLVQEWIKWCCCCCCCWMDLVTMYNQFLRSSHSTKTKRRLIDRFNEHRRPIINPFCSYTPTAVSRQFLTSGHAEDHMILIPLEQLHTSRDSIRKAREAFLIHRAKTLEPAGFNRKVI